MNKQDAIQKILDIKIFLEQSESFKGRSQILKSCENRMRLLERYKFEDKNCELLVRECDRDIERAGIKRLPKQQEMF